MRISIQVRDSEIRFNREPLVPGQTIVVRSKDDDVLAEGEYVPTFPLSFKQKQMVKEGKEVKPRELPFVCKVVGCVGAKGGLRAYVLNEKGMPHSLDISVAGMSFRAYKPTYDRQGNQLPTPFVTASGILKEGLYHFDLRPQDCRVFFVPKQTLMDNAKKKAEQNAARKRVKARLRALKAFAEPVKLGKWRTEDPRYRPVILNEYVRFPDHSGITLPKEGDLSCQIFVPPYGPEECLASLWGGWTPAQELTVDTAPPALKEPVGRALDLLPKFPDSSVHLLPGSGESSPIMKLGNSGSGVMVYRTIGLSALGLPE